MEDRSKVEENSTWWSDYQASTKLRRKFQTTQSFDDLDDLLGDLTGEPRETKTPDVPSSSTSGYDTESPGATACSSPEDGPDTATAGPQLEGGSPVFFDADGNFIAQKSEVVEEENEKEVTTGDLLPSADSLACPMGRDGVTLAPVSSEREGAQTVMSCDDSGVSCDDSSRSVTPLTTVCDAVYSRSPSPSLLSCDASSRSITPKAVIDDDNDTIKSIVPITPTIEEALKVEVVKEDGKLSTVQDNVVNEPTKEHVKEPTKKFVKKPNIEPDEEPIKEHVKEPFKDSVKMPTIEPDKEPIKEHVKEPTKDSVKNSTKKTIKEATKELIEEPTKVSVKEPTKESVTEPTNASVKEPIKEHVKESTKESVKKPTIETDKEHVKEPTKESIKKSTKEPVKEVIKESAKEPTKELVEEPTKESVKESTKESVKETTNEYVKEPINEPAKELTKEPVKQGNKKPASEPTKESVKKSTKESVKGATKGSIKEPTKESVKKPTKESVKDATKGSIKEPTKESAKEPSNESVQEPTKEIANEPTNESVKESIKEPLNELIKEPDKEPTKEPVKELTKEPVMEPTNQSVEEPIKEPEKEPTKGPVKEATKEPAKEPNKEPAKEPNKEPAKEPNRSRSKSSKRSPKKAVRKDSVILVTNDDGASYEAIIGDAVICNKKVKPKNSLSKSQTSAAVNSMTDFIPLSGTIKEERETDEPADRTGGQEAGQEVPLGSNGQDSNIPGMEKAKAEPEITAGSKTNVGKEDTVDTAGTHASEATLVESRSKDQTCTIPCIGESPVKGETSDADQPSPSSVAHKVVDSLSCSSEVSMVAHWSPPPPTAKTGPNTQEKIVDEESVSSEKESNLNLTKQETEIRKVSHTENKVQNVISDMSKEVVQIAHNLSEAKQTSSSCKEADIIGSLSTSATEIPIVTPENQDTLVKLESSSNLSHPTSDRVKAPPRRPPSTKFLRKNMDGEECEGIDSNTGLTKDEQIIPLSTQESEDSIINLQSSVNPKSPQIEFQHSSPGTSSAEPKGVENMSDLIKTLENINDKADSEPIYAVIIPKSKRNSGTQPTKEESSKKGEETNALSEETIRKQSLESIKTTPRGQEDTKNCSQELSQDSKVGEEAGRSLTNAMPESAPVRECKQEESQEGNLDTLISPQQQSATAAKAPPSPSTVKVEQHKSELSDKQDGDSALKSVSRSLSREGSRPLSRDGDFKDHEASPKTKNKKPTPSVQRTFFSKLVSLQKPAEDKPLIKRTPSDTDKGRREAGKLTKRSSLTETEVRKEEAPSYVKVQPPSKIREEAKSWLEGELERIKQGKSKQSESESNQSGSTENVNNDEADAQEKCLDCVTPNPSSPLSHPTADRVKAPPRRPPSTKFLRKKMDGETTQPEEEVVGKMEIFLSPERGRVVDLSHSRGTSPAVPKSADPSTYNPTGGASAAASQPQDLLEGKAKEACLPAGEGAATPGVKERPADQTNIVGEKNETGEVINREERTTADAGKDGQHEALGQEAAKAGQASSTDAVMGNAKSTPRDDIEVISTVNENIKKVCVNPNYKASKEVQVLVKDVLSQVVNANNPEDLSQKMSGNKMKIFLRPLSETDMVNLYNPSFLRQDSNTEEVPTAKKTVDKTTIIPIDPTINATEFLSANSVEGQEKPEAIKVNINNSLSDINPTNTTIEDQQLSPNMSEKNDATVPADKSADFSNIEQTAAIDIVKKEDETKEAEIVANETMEEAYIKNDLQIDNTSLITVSQGSDNITISKESNQEESTVDLVKETIKTEDRAEDIVVAEENSKMDDVAHMKEDNVIDKHLADNELQENIPTQTVIDDEVNEDDPSTEVVESPPQKSINDVRLISVTEDIDVVATKSGENKQTNSGNAAEYSEVHLLNYEVKEASSENPHQQGSSTNLQLDQASKEPHENNEPIVEAPTTEQTICSSPQKDNTISEPSTASNVPGPVQTEDEVDRQKLVDIIQINTSKFCRTVSYNCNETAQRKVRAVFNILADSETAEDIYDKILCEGLQWFVEFHAEGDDIPEEDFGDNDPVADRRQSTPEKESIVSKILKEVNSPNIERKDKPSETMESGDSPGKGSSTESLDYSLSRHKASRQVRKYVRTSNSLTDYPALVDSLEEAGEGHQVVDSDIADMSVALGQSIDKMAESEGGQESGDGSIPVASSVPEEDKIVIDLAPDNIVDDAPVELIQTEPVTVAKTEPDTMENRRQSEVTVTVEEPTSDQKKDADNIIEPPSSQLMRTSASPLCSSLSVERKGSRELSIENAQRRMEMQSAQRSFSEALRDSKAKRRNQSSRTCGGQDEDSIVSRMLRQTTGQGTQESPSEPLQAAALNVDVSKPEVVEEAHAILPPVKPNSTESIEVVKPERAARERTESECSDTMPDLCPIQEEEEEQRRVEEMLAEIKEKEKQQIQTEPTIKVMEQEPSADFQTETDRELTPLFFTDFDDDDTEADISCADVTEHPATVGTGANSMEPQIRKMVENLFDEMVSQNKEETEDSQKEKLSGGMDQLISKLVSNILELVLTIASPPTQEIAANPANREIQSINNFEPESEDESEMSECESIHDMFDLSMQRLTFIENSFKTLSTSTLDLRSSSNLDLRSSSNLDLRSVTPDLQALALDTSTDHDDREKLDKIREILASGRSSEDQLKAIDQIANDKNY